MPLPSEVLFTGNKNLDFEKRLMLKKISEMDNLPVPNHHVMKVMLLLRNEAVKVPDVVEAIEKDQSLVARILKLINSGYYGLRKTIDTVERAVTLLGILNIKHVVYSATILDLFSDQEKIEWNHAHSSSVLMAHIMREYQIPAASNLPLTMLMHDIGKVVLRRYSPKKYEMTVMQAERERHNIYETEERVIRINHADAGALLLEKWQMTNDIIYPVAFHHAVDLVDEDTNAEVSAGRRPQQSLVKQIPADYRVETALVQFVNWIDCRARGILCTDPSQSLLTEAGFEVVEPDFWIEFQDRLIEELDEGGARRPADNRPPTDMRVVQSDTRKMSKQGADAESPPRPRPTPAAEKPAKVETPSRAPGGGYTSTDTEKVPKLADAGIVGTGTDKLVAFEAEAPPAKSVKKVESDSQASEKTGLGSKFRSFFK